MFALLDGAIAAAICVVIYLLASAEGYRGDLWVLVPILLCFAFGSLMPILRVFLAGLVSFAAFFAYRLSNL
jgi:hypothetical protein